MHSGFLATLIHQTSGIWRQYHTTVETKKLALKGTGLRFSLKVNKMR